MNESVPGEVALERAMGASAPARAALLERYHSGGVLRFAEPRLGAALASSFRVAEPCRALVVAWALSSWPEGAAADLLRALVERPPRASLLVAISAIDAMAETGANDHGGTLAALLDGHRGSRLVWHALVALARIEGSGARARAFLGDGESHFDAELVSGLPRVLSAIPEHERASVVEALLRSKDSARLAAALRLAQDAPVAKSLEPALVELANTGVQLGPREARHLVRAVALGANDLAVRRLAWSASVAPAVRWAAAARLPPAEAAEVLGLYGACPLFEEPAQLEACLEALLGPT